MTTRTESNTEASITITYGEGRFTLTHPWLDAPITVRTRKKLIAELEKFLNNPISTAMAANSREATESDDRVAVQFFEVPYLKGVPIFFCCVDENTKWDGENAINPTDEIRKHGGVILLSPEKYSQFVKVLHPSVGESDVR